MTIQITTPVLGNAASGDVRAGKSFSGASVTPGTVGTISTQASGQTITPNTSNQVYGGGIYDSGFTVQGDTNLVAGNIAAGVSIFGVAGASVVAAGTATPSQVLSGVTFTSAGSSSTQTGTMPNDGAVTLTPSGTGTVAIPAGYHNGSGNVAQVNVPAGDVLTGTTIAGVSGTMPDQGSPTVAQTNSSQSLAAGYYGGITIPALPTGTQTFASSGIFTVPTNVYNVFAIVIGGGGSGGTGNASANYPGGGGAGGGGCAYGSITVAPGQQITVTVGSGGSAAVPNGQNGSSGTASSFSTLVGGGGSGGTAGGTSLTGAGGSGGSYSGPYGVNGNSGQNGYDNGSNASSGGIGGQPIMGHGGGSEGEAYGSASPAGSPGTVILFW